MDRTIFTSQQWQRVTHLFEATLAHDSAERAAFLAQADKRDEEITREVESLLAAHEKDATFMNTPVGSLLVVEKPMLTAGQHFGPYEVISLLGEGGMGQVYQAIDTRLGRKVALKLLPSSYTGDLDRVRRFGQEARAASALNHPNIITIHEIGKTDSIHFIATEFVAGGTLREHLKDTRMTIGEVLDVAAQVSSALAAAHEAGIVHRDIKPENIMVRHDRFVKVLDFGLAKLTTDQTELAQRQSAESKAKTNPGMVMGTAAYMSPEQARGEDVDARTDIWSLGVVLYEMATGRPPFEGKTPSHVIVSILENEPPPLPGDTEALVESERIVTKALRKNREERYQTAGEMALALKNLKEELEVEARLRRKQQPGANGKEAAANGDGLQSIETFHEPAARTGHIIPARSTASVEYLVGGIKRHKTFAGAALLVFLISAIGLTYFAINRHKAKPIAPGKKSIAVLPVKPINAANRDEIYEIGIAESLIHRLSSIEGIIVRPLSATRKYADIGQDPIDAGKGQQVDYVLASNYQLVDGKIRITAQLFNVASRQIEDTYKIERGADDIFGMQDAVAYEFGNKLMERFALTPNILMAKRGTTNEEAYWLYLQGKNLTNRRNPADIQKAVGYFEQAVRLDPDYALAYAWMAHAYHGLGALAVELPRVGNEKAKEAVKRALELDGNLAEAYAARGKLNFAFEWDFAAAEQDFLRAIELEPNNDSAHGWYALLLAYRGLFDKAMAEIEVALAINPGSLLYQRDRGRILYYSRRYDEAIVQINRVVEQDANFLLAYGWLWRAYEMKGDDAGAYESLIKLHERIAPDLVETYQKAYEIAGWQGVRRKYLEILKLNEAKLRFNFSDFVSLSALLGEKEQAFEYLNKAVERREWAIITLNVEPTLDSLRDDRRFAELVSRLGLK